MANNSTIFPTSDGGVIGADIEKVLNALKTNKEAAAYAVELIHGDHRTHQQSFMRLFVAKMLEAWAKDKEHGRFDRRNQATVIFAENAMLFDDGCPVFPYV